MRIDGLEVRIDAGIKLVQEQIKSTNTRIDSLEMVVGKNGQAHYHNVCRYWHIDCD